MISGACPMKMKPRSKPILKHGMLVYGASIVSSAALAASSNGLCRLWIESIIHCCIGLTCGLLGIGSSNLSFLSWNSLISNLPNPHFLQTYEWGQVKAKYGWTPLYAVWDVDGKWKVESDPNQFSTFHSPVAAA